MGLFQTVWPHQMLDLDRHIHLQQDLTMVKDTRYPVLLRRQNTSSFWLVISCESYKGQWIVGPIHDHSSCQNYGMFPDIAVLEHAIEKYI